MNGIKIKKTVITLEDKKIKYDKEKNQNYLISISGKEKQDYKVKIKL